MLNRWLLDGNYSSGWQTLIADPNTWPKPQNELDSTLRSTSRILPLLDGSKARISRNTKFMAHDLAYAISVFHTDEDRTYSYPATPVTYSIKAIVEDLIKNDVSIRLRFQEYVDGSWDTQQTICGYFINISKIYKMYKTPMLYVVNLSIQRFDVDGSGIY